MRMHQPGSKPISVPQVEPNPVHQPVPTSPSIPNPVREPAQPRRELEPVR